MTAKPKDKVEKRLDQVAQICAARGSRLTDIRRGVLGLVLRSPGPVGAYALLDQLKTQRPNAAPVTVYRALDFLIENGLIHKVERLNAFVACTGHGDNGHHEHAVQFLICRRCGTVAEMDDRGIAAAVSHAAGQTGFRPAHATIEVEGTCGACAAIG
jgi:Fur family zinc uptake transcriptional regulator